MKYLLSTFFVVLLCGTTVLPYGKSASLFSNGTMVIYTGLQETETVVLSNEASTINLIDFRGNVVAQQGVNYMDSKTFVHADFGPGAHSLELRKSNGELIDVEWNVFVN